MAEQEQHAGVRRGSTRTRRSRLGAAGARGCARRSAAASRSACISGTAHLFYAATAGATDANRTWVERKAQLVRLTHKSSYRIVLERGDKPRRSIRPGRSISRTMRSPVAHSPSRCAGSGLSVRQSFRGSMSDADHEIVRAASPSCWATMRIIWRCRSSESAFICRMRVLTLAREVEGACPSKTISGSSSSRKKRWFSRSSTRRSRSRSARRSATTAIKAGHGIVADVRTWDRPLFYMALPGTHRRQSELGAAQGQPGAAADARARYRVVLEKSWDGDYFPPRRGPRQHGLCAGGRRLSRSGSRAPG